MVNTPNSYQRQAEKTSQFLIEPMDKEFVQPERMKYAALSLANEVGELLDHVKKYTYHGKRFDQWEISKESGDVLWSISELLSSCGLNLQACMQSNLEKLRERHGESYNAKAHYDG